MQKRLLYTLSALLLLSTVGIWAEGQKEEPAAPMIEEIQENEPLSIKEAEGVVITAIIEDSAAERAGLMRGDIIVQVDDTLVDSVAGITDAVSELSHGDDVQLIILRGGKSMTITLTLETRIGMPLIGIRGSGPNDGARSGRMMDQDDIMEYFRQSPFGMGQQDGAGERRGWMLEDMPEEVRDAVEAGDASYVDEVVADSPAEAAGVETGAVIYLLDGEPVDEGDLRSAVLAHEPGDTITLTVYQDEEILELEVTLGDAEGNPQLGVQYYPMGAQRQMMQRDLNRTMPRDLDMLDG